MLFSKSIALLSLCVASVLANFSNETSTSITGTKATKVLAPVTSVETKTTAWTLSDETTTSYITFTYYKTHVLTTDATGSDAVIATQDSEKVASSLYSSPYSTTTLTSTVIYTQSHHYGNVSTGTTTAAVATTTSLSNETSTAAPVTVYVTVTPITSYVTITAGPVTKFVTVTAAASNSAVSQLSWSNSTRNN